MFQYIFDLFPMAVLDRINGNHLCMSKALGFAHDVSLFRIRRVKCDEARPDCRRCSSTGRRCEWYSDNAKWAVAVAAPPPTQQAINLAWTGPASLPLIVQDSDHQERRSFDFFRARTAPQLSGFFHSDFWYRVILQAAHHNESLWHAMVALGSIHERFTVGDQSVFARNHDSEQGGLALKQYTKAISKLTSPTGSGAKPDIDVFLAACILFSSFEVGR